MGRVKDMATDFGKLTDEQMEVWSKDMIRMVKDVRDEAAWDAMKGKQLKDIVIESTIKEQDFDVLRDFLVDMCSATLPEHPPSQKDWDELRDRTKAAAVEHSLLNRDEKKAAKKPGGLESTLPKIMTMPPRHGKSELVSKVFPQWATMIKSMPSDTPLQGKTADLLIIDDLGAN